MHFYVGLLKPSHARHFKRCMISVNRLVRRRSDFEAGRWIMDSGAFTSVSRYGTHLLTPEAYARQIVRWKRCGQLEAAVAQDWMCEPFVLEVTGLTVREHQRRTIRYYLALRWCDPGVYVMPVLQGYRTEDYLQHLEDYGNLLEENMWVGVGSVCKRNAQPEEVLEILSAIKQRRQDLRLHGFGLKLTALRMPGVRRLLYSSDSMAWSFAARRRGGDPNSWQAAHSFAEEIKRMLQCAED